MDSNVNAIDAFEVGWLMDFFRPESSLHKQKIYGLTYISNFE